MSIFGGRRQRQFRGKYTVGGKGEAILKRFLQAAGASCPYLRPAGNVATMGNCEVRWPSHPPRLSHHHVEQGFSSHVQCHVLQSAPLPGRSGRRRRDRCAALPHPAEGVWRQRPDRHRHDRRGAANPPTPPRRCTRVTGLQGGARVVAVERPLAAEVGGVDCRIRQTPACRVAAPAAIPTASDLPQVARSPRHRRRDHHHLRSLARPAGDPRLPIRQGRLRREAAGADDCRGPGDGQRRAQASAGVSNRCSSGRIPRDRQACELIRNGRLGAIREVISANYGSSKPASAYDLKSEPAPQGLDWDRWCGQTALAAFSFQRYLTYERPGWQWIREYSGGLLTNWVRTAWTWSNALSARTTPARSNRARGKRARPQGLVPVRRRRDRAPLRKRPAAGWGAFPRRQRRVVSRPRQVQNRAHRHFQGRESAPAKCGCRAATITCRTGWTASARGGGRFPTLRSATARRRSATCAASLAGWPSAPLGPAEGDLPRRRGGQWLP